MPAVSGRNATGSNDPDPQYVRRMPKGVIRLTAENAKKAMYLTKRRTLLPLTWKKLMAIWWLLLGNVVASIFVIYGTYLIVFH